MASFDVLGELIALSNRQKPPGRVSGLIRGAIAGGATPNIAAGGGTDIMRAMQSSLQDRVEDELIFHNMRRQVLGDIAQEQDRRRSGERQDVRTRADLIGATGQPGQVDFGGSSFQLPGIGGKRRMETEADIETARAKSPVETQLEIERMRQLFPVRLEQERQIRDVDTTRFNIPEGMRPLFGGVESLNLPPTSVPNMLTAMGTAYQRSPQGIAEFRQGLHSQIDSIATSEDEAKRSKALVDAQIAAGDRQGAADIVKGMVPQKRTPVPGVDVPLPADVEAQRDRIARARSASTGTTADTAKEIAGAIERGEQPPTLTGLYRYGAGVRGELAKRGYNLTTALKDWQAVQKHLATLNGPQQERLRQAITFTADSLDVIEELYNEWRQTGLPGGFKAFNKAALAVAKNTPGENGAIAASLEAQINDLVSELGTVYKGGNASTDESLRLAAENLKANWNEETFKKALGLIRKNLQIRMNSILTSQPVGTSTGRQGSEAAPSAATEVYDPKTRTFKKK